MHDHSIGIYSYYECFQAAIGIIISHWMHHIYSHYYIHIGLWTDQCLAMQLYISLFTTVTYQVQVLYCNYPYTIGYQSAYVHVSL